MELFKNIIGYESQYEISSLGRVKNKVTGNFISTKPGKIGYPKVNLWKNNKYKTFYIHRLIAIHFIPNPNNYSEVNHIDGTRMNNDIKNLEWVTRLGNHLHAISTGAIPLGENRKNSKLTNNQAKKIFKLSHSSRYKIKELSKMFSISTTQVIAIRDKKEWKHIHKK